MVINQHSILFLLSSLLIVLAPLFRAGNRPLPIMLLELVAVLLILFVLTDKDSKKAIPKSLMWLTLAIFITPLIYVIPFPSLLLQDLSGRETYNAIQLWVVQNSDQISLGGALSIIPQETYSALLRLLPPVAIFIAVICLPIRKVLWFCYIFLFISGLEALLAIAQYVSQGDLLYLGMRNSSFAQGTYPNRNHFAALMEMAIPIAIAFALIEFSKRRGHRFRAKKLNTLFLYIVIIAIMLLAALLSHSRAGMFLAFFTAITIVFIFRNDFGKRYKRFVISTILLIPVVTMLNNTGVSLINRLIVKSPLDDGRVVIFKHTMEGISEFFPIGSGPGTYSYIYRAFQPIDQIGHIRHAHNDYLELLFETGVIGGALLIIFFVMFVLTWRKLQKVEKVVFGYVQLGAGTGMLALLMHGLVDFNFHIPANVIYFALLAGIFFHVTEDVSAHSVNTMKQKRRRKRRFNKSQRLQVRERESSETIKFGKGKKEATNPWDG